MWIISKLVEVGCRTAIQKAKIRETDSTLAEWLKTSRATISLYKRRLKEQGFLNIDTSRKTQKFSVKYFPKQ
jgi:transcriptional regulator